MYNVLYNNYIPEKNNQEYKLSVIGVFRVI